MAKGAMIIPVCKLRVLLHGKFEQFQGLGNFTLFIDSFSLVEVVELDGEGGIDAAEVVHLCLLQFFLQTATDRLPFYLEKLLPLDWGHFIFVPGRQWSVLYGARPQSLCVAAERSVKALCSLIALLFFVAIVHFYFPELQVVKIGSKFRVSLGLFIAAGGRACPCSVWLLFEGGLFGSFFEDLLAFVDEFEPCFVVLEGEGKV